MSRRAAIAAAVLLAACLAATSCGIAGEESAVTPAGGGAPSATPIAAPPYVPRGSAPPARLTWRIGITEDVYDYEMHQLYASIVTANNTLWNITEGQVRVEAIVIRDNVAPGVTAGTFVDNLSAIDTSDLDVIVWPRAYWDFPAAGAVIVRGGLGRAGRVIILPLDASPFVLVHEASHLVWNLSWEPGPMLVDEYVDGLQDPSCMMETLTIPTRWCSEENHVHQTSQPHSCWKQILIDYPAFQHLGREFAPNVSPPPSVTYEDR